uniref:DDT domain-containing protein n=1 Tax=Anopheles atroparvus TaxID=41427 RepID=A0A182IRR8_ANOAO
MFTTFIGLIDIQSWWEVPCIAHFCSLFSTAFHLPRFDIEDLEEALLTNPDVEGEVDLKVYSARLLPELIVALLKGCDALVQIRSSISPSNYQMFLKRLLRQKCQEYNVENPFNTDTDFEKLPLRTKILILKYLCDFRLDSLDVCTTFANYEADSIRLQPIGYDRNGSSYWHFFGTRLYREDYATGGKPKSTKAAAKAAASVWQVICFTEEDWRTLTQKLDNSTNAKERDLHALLVESFLPHIPKLFRDKERERRSRVLERPRSSRLRILQERVLREQEEQRKEQEEQEQQQKRAKQQQDGESEPLAEVHQNAPPLTAEAKALLLSEARAKRAERRLAARHSSALGRRGHKTRAQEE